MKDKITVLKIENLKEFEGHPYKVTDNEEMEALALSIKENGILSPVVVRPIEGTGDYEIISGHRRIFAAKKAGLTEVPALIYAISHEEAIIALVDSNLYREHILPSEKAFAYVRADAIEEVVTYELQRLADFLRYDQEGFAQLLADKTNKDMLDEQKNAKTQIDQSLARINKIDVLYERLYEDNVSGKVTDSFYMELSHKYENEKEELKKKIFNLKIQLDELNKKAFHKEMFLSAIEKFMEMKTITAPLIRELIDHIEVHETEGEGKYKTQRIVIFYRFVGYIEIPEMALNQGITKDTRQGVSVSYIPKAITA